MTNRPARKAGRFYFGLAPPRAEEIPQQLARPALLDAAIDFRLMVAGRLLEPAGSMFDRAALGVVGAVIQAPNAGKADGSLLPHGAVSYQSFVGAYAVATVVGLISSVPGGAGVFESAISTLLPGVAAAPLAAAFLGYRLAFYLLPLVIAAVWLAIDTAIHHRR